MTQSRYTHQHTSMLFPTPLLTYQVADAERINALLLEEIGERRQSEAGVLRSNKSGWHSESDFFARTEPGHGALSRAIRGVVIDATRRVAGAENSKNLRFLMDGWININPANAYNVPHDHPGSFWSGAYYVVNQDPGEAELLGGAISFLGPHHPPAGQAVIKAPVFGASHTLRPAPGTLLLFPSNARHWVHPNTSASDRITVAFNATLVGGPAAKQSAGDAAGAIPASA